MILTAPDYEAFLSMECEDVDPTSEDTQLVVEQLLAEVQGVGVGLAANQIGHRLAIVVMQLDAPSEEYTVAINPQLLYGSTERIYSVEGCLSIPGKTYVVPRYPQVTLHYQDLTGQPQTRQLTGFAAVVAQHEVDHVRGILISHVGKAVLPSTPETVS